jgi:DNA polymerase elongation subunit (family B)
VTDTNILFFDIECSMAKVYTYDLFRPFIGHKDIIEPSRMIAYSAKWKGKKGVLFKSEFHDGRDEMLQGLHDLLDAADIVVGYNIKRYDIPWVSGEHVVEGFLPPSPFKVVDLYQTVKSNSRFLSKKLDYVSGRLLDDHKKAYSMAEMWRIVDDPNVDPTTKAREWNRMRSYARKDTALMEPLFERLLPWLKMPHPVTSDPEACPNCGGTELQKRGVARTQFSEYPRLQCTSCGKWLRGASRTSTTNLRTI